jgi:hypothetical protein
MSSLDKLPWLAASTRLEAMVQDFESLDKLCERVVEVQEYKVRVSIV